jgi:hypothetical protein
MRTDVVLAGVAVAISGAWPGSGLSPKLVAAQNASAAAAPCRDRPCALAFDWGPGKTAGSWAPDRKYGATDQFESKVRSGLAGRGFRIVDRADSTLVITLRPTMQARAMCDEMPGTNTDYSCTAMSDLAVNFASTLPSTKAPSALRLSSRCNMRESYLTLPIFAQYAAEMIAWAIEGQAKNEKRPSRPTC